MEQKSRKLLARLGAAFMLGLSMFNFGAAWNKMRGSEIPRNTRNIRKRVQEEVNVEVREIATIAEEEAQAVLAMKQFEQDDSQQRSQTEEMSFSQKAVRYGAIGVWTISAGLIFSSAIFNYPFALGKGMLSLLPGVPHVASLQLETASRFFEAGGEIPVRVLLDSQGESVQGATIFLRYDSARLAFQRYEISEGLFDSNKEYSASPADGAVSLTVENSLGGVEAKKDLLGTFYFQAKEAGASNIKIDQEKSFVFRKNEKGEYANILGKAGAVELSISPSKNELAICSKIENSAGEDDVDEWELLAKGEILPAEDSKWKEIDDEWAFACSHDEAGAVRLLLSGTSANLESIQLALQDADDSETFLNISKKWQENGRYFFGAVIEGISSGEGAVSFKLDVNLSDKNLSWPQRGQAKLIFQ